MPFVSEVSIEKTWKRIASLSGPEILKLQKQHRKAQKPLVQVVYSVLGGFRQDACGLLIYVFHVVLEAFRTEAHRLDRIDNRNIKLPPLSRASQPPFNLSRAIELSPEPSVLQYVYDAFTEAADDVVLSDSEREAFLAILQTVIDCLNKACHSE